MCVFLHFHRVDLPDLLCFGVLGVPLFRPPCTPSDAPVTRARRKNKKKKYLKKSKINYSRTHARTHAPPTYSAAAGPERPAHTCYPSSPFFPFFFCLFSHFPFFLFPFFLFPRFFFSGLFVVKFGSTLLLHGSRLIALPPPIYLPGQNDCDLWRWEEIGKCI